MTRVIRLCCAGSVLVALIAGTFVSTRPAHAVIYCKTAGVPRGCIVRPRPVVYCKTVGVPKGCIVRR
jgi:hypothetical protein